MDKTYRPEDFGKSEVELIRKFQLQRDDARDYFTRRIKPQLDRAYKLYIAYNGDRAKEIASWQANTFVPYINGVVETLMPRILDARPEFSIQGRTEDDQLKSSKIQNLVDYTWEKVGMDDLSEDVVRASLIYGSGYIQAGWKKDSRLLKFLKTKDITKKIYKWAKKEVVFYDGPTAEWVDNYDLWYDWHNIPRESKQYWFKRSILTGAEIKRKFNMADKKRLAMAFASGAGDLTDYAAIRNQVKLVHDKINKGSDKNQESYGSADEMYKTSSDDSEDLRMYEVFQWFRPFEDSFSVMVNDIPILKGGEMPIPFDFKETPFINVPYLKLPNEFEGIGIPLLLENPQIMLNMIKNQRLDAMTLNIHKMWIVNPLANIDKKDLVTRPFGIIYSVDPAGVREVEFSDVKASAYKEEELLKGDMRYASGVDDSSMGIVGGAESATEVRHLRESTLERVRLFVNHLGYSYSILMRYWISMYRQFYTDKMIIRVVGDSGELEYPLIEKDDLDGSFDFKSTVIPSIAGKNDIEKKQGMDLFQLLISLPFVDPKKLTSKLLHSWNWSLDAVTKQEEQPQQVPGMGGQMPGAEGQMPGAEGQMPGMDPAAMRGGEAEGMTNMPNIGSGEIPQSVIQQAMGMLGGGQAQSQFAEAGAPINLLETGGQIPPIVAPIGGTTNPRGFNRGGKVNTNIPMKENSNPESQILNQANNLQS